MTIHEEVVDEVSKRLVLARKKSVPNVPKKVWESHIFGYGASGIASGSVIGAFIGSSMGVAAFGTAVAATFPLAIVGAVLLGLAGCLVGASIRRKEAALEQERLAEALDSIALPTEARQILCLPGVDAGKD